MKQSKDKVVIGIDPGLTCTGVIASLVRQDNTMTVLGGATFESPPKENHNVLEHVRIGELAEQVGFYVNDAVAEHLDKQDVVLCIERPVWTRNADAFSKQWRLFQAILQETALAFDLEVVEVYPLEAKKALTGTGNASKEDMIFASVWSDVECATQAQKEALSDAHGIALCHLIRPSRGHRPSTTLSSAFTV